MELELACLSKDLPIKYTTNMLPGSSPRLNVTKTVISAWEISEEIQRQTSLETHRFVTEAQRVKNGKLVPYTKY